jgi:glutamate synthase domain-containing protein 3
MSGGIAYVYDDQGDFSSRRCNKSMVELEPLINADDIGKIRALLARHRDLTGSPRAAWILEHWAEARPLFIKVFPHEYKRVLGVARNEGTEGADTAAKLPVSPRTPSPVAATAEVQHG